MTRQAGMQPGATSSKAGRFQAAKPLPEPEPARGPSWHIPKMPPSKSVTLYWNERGGLYEDEGLTRPTSWQIFERSDDDEDDL